MPFLLFWHQMYHSQPLPASHMSSYYSTSPLLPMMTQSCDAPPHHSMHSYRPMDEIIMPTNLENRSSRSIERILDEHGNERVREDYSNGGRGPGLPYFPFPSPGADLFAMNCASQLFGALNLNHFAYVLNSFLFCSTNDALCPEVYHGFIFRLGCVGPSKKEAEVMPFFV